MASAGVLAEPAVQLSLQELPIAREQPDGVGQAREPHRQTSLYQLSSVSVTPLQCYWSPDSELFVYVQTQCLFCLKHPGNKWWSFRHRCTKAYYCK